MLGPVQCSSAPAADFPVKILQSLVQTAPVTAAALCWTGTKMDCPDFGACNPAVPPLSPPSSARAQQWARKKTDWSQDSASFEIPGVQNISSACIPIKGASLGAGIPIPLPLVSRKVAPEKNQLLALQCKSNCPISSHNLLKNLFSFTVPSFLHVELLAPSSHQTFPTLLALLWISCSYLPNKTRQGCGLKSYWISWHKVV